MRKKIFIGLAAVAVVSVGFGLGRTLEPFGANASPDATDPAKPQTSAAEAALADGVVTADEYGLAFDRFVACVTQSGAEPATVRTTDRFGRIGMGFKMAGTTPADARLLQATTESCRRTELDAVEISWVSAHRPTPEEEMDARRLTSTCLAASGIDVSTASAKPLHDLILDTLVKREGDQVQILGTCLNKTASDLNWPGYAGS